MNKRIFVALKVTEELKNEIFDWQSKHTNLPVSWIQMKDLHITILPPWEEENVDGVIEKLSTLSGKVGGIPITLDVATVGPNHFSPRLIWATGEVPQKIFSLREILKNTLGRENLKSNFFTHLTLARFTPENFAKFPVARLKEEISWKMFASELVLMESILVPGGSTYEIIKEVKL
ncbi:MAG: RNA 2',3'-cyclic phosphodiesterase [bacterium]